MEILCKPSSQPWLLTFWKFQVDEVDPNKTYSELGFDSFKIVTFCGLINSELNIELTPAIFWEHNSLNELAIFLQESKATSFH